MANVRQLRRRIRSVQNTAKVTRAMQMIAASKMRRAQDRVAAARPYASKIREVIAGLTSMSPGDDDIHPLLERRPVRRSLIVHVTPDRGLAGGLPTNMNRATAERVLRAESPVVVITIGRKGRNFFTRTGADIIADYSGMSDRPTVADCRFSGNSYFFDNFTFSCNYACFDCCCSDINTNNLYHGNQLFFIT